MFTFDPLHLPGPWRVWFRPGRYAALIADLCADKSGDADRIATLERLLSEQRKETARLATEKMDLATKLMEERQRAHFLERELEKTKGLLEEAGDVDRALNEFSAQLEGVENMKKQYIKTIRTLKLQLRDARSTIRALSGEDLDNELTALPTGRSASSMPSVPREETPAPQENVNADIEDDLSPGKPIVFGRTANPDTGDRENPDDTDWLLPLPPAL